MMVVRTLDERKHSIVNRLWLRCKVYSPNLLLSTNEPLIELISAKERFFLTVMPSAASSNEPFNYCSNNPCHTSLIIEKLLPLFVKLMS